MPINAEPCMDVYQKLLDLPENMVGEIIGGELYSQPRPSPKHALASSSLGGELDGPFYKGRGGPGGWWILFEPEIHIGGEVLVPDLCGWKKDRLPQLPDTAFFELAPDWVCEILSQNTAQKDRILKMPIYAKNNVPFIWLIDPTLRTLEAYQLDNKYWKLIGAYAEDDRVSVAPFEEISIDLKLLWGQ